MNFLYENASNKKSAEKPSELLNDLFNSDSVDKILEFYSSFNTVEDLIGWMRERPKGRAEIYEVEGDKNIIVVIPTADFNGKYAKHCRNDIFNGFHMIFVESGGKDDPYFNFSHNVNTGMKKALTYKPRWIIFSSDDMFKIDEPEILTRELLKLDNEKYDIIFTKPAKYHSIPVMFSEMRMTMKLYLYLFKKGGRLKLRLYNKFNIRYFLPRRSFYTNFFFKKGLMVISIASFGIFSSAYVHRRDGILYDECYINATEDIDLSLRLTAIENRYSIIDFRIGDYINSTLGNSLAKQLRDLAGDARLNYLVDTGNHPISKLLSKDRNNTQL